MQIFYVHRLSAKCPVADEMTFKELPVMHFQLMIKFKKTLPHHQNPRPLGHEFNFNKIVTIHSVWLLNARGKSGGLLKI